MIWPIPGKKNACQWWEAMSPVTPFDGVDYWLTDDTATYIDDIPQWLTSLATRSGRGSVTMGR